MPPALLLILLIALFGGGGYYACGTYGLAYGGGIGFMWCVIIAVLLARGGW